MNIFVINDSEIARCLYGIFDKYELSKYIANFRKRYPLANEIEIYPAYKQKIGFYLKPLVDVFSVPTKITIPVSCLDIENVYKENDWNPYSSVQPPGDGVAYLVQDTYGDIYKAFFMVNHDNISGWRRHYSDNHFIKNIIAFRNLPEVYKNEL